MDNGMDPMDELALRRLGATSAEDEVMKGWHMRFRHNEIQMTVLQQRVTMLESQIGLLQSQMKEAGLFIRRMNAAMDRNSFSVPEKPWGML